MVSGTSFPRHLAELALLYACAIMLALAAPVLIDVLQSSQADWPLISSQAVTDPTDNHAHLWGMADEPLILTSIGGAPPQRLMLSFPPTHPTARAWCSLPLVHPPSILNSI